MERTLKFLRRLDRKMFLRVLACIEAILAGSLENLDISPLRELPHHFRCRIGSIRIVFMKYPSGNIIVDADYRKDVYRRLKR